jgi:hypothetical protein
MRSRRAATHSRSLCDGRVRARGLRAVPEGRLPRAACGQARLSRRSAPRIYSETTGSNRTGRPSTRAGRSRSPWALQRSSACGCRRCARIPIPRTCCLPTSDVRVFNDQVDEWFGWHKDMIVVGMRGQHLRTQSAGDRRSDYGRHHGTPWRGECQTRAIEPRVFMAATLVARFIIGHRSVCSLPSTVCGMILPQESP